MITTVDIERGRGLARTGSPWSVKGIDQETRDIVRSRAAAADLTIGAWINQAILNHVQGAVPTVPGPSRILDSPATLTTTAPAMEINVAPGTIGNQAILTLVDTELAASRNRLDEALRPVGFALRDLALRLVAAEATRRGGGPPRDASKPDGALPPVTADNGDLPVPALDAGGGWPEPTPPMNSLNPEIDPADLPLPPARRARGDAVANLDAPVALDITGPTHGAGLAEDDRPDTRRRPDPVPPTGPLGALDLSGLEPPAEPTASIVQFNGFQGGYEPSPTEAQADARKATARRTFRAFKVAAIILPFLVLGSATATYYYADRVGLAPVRDRLRSVALGHAGSIALTVGDAYQALEQGVTGAVGSAMRLLDAPDIVAAGTPSPGETAPRETEPLTQNGQAPTPDSDAKPAITRKADRSVGTTSENPEVKKRHDENGDCAADRRGTETPNWPPSLGRENRVAARGGQKTAPDRRPAAGSSGTPRNTGLATESAGNITEDRGASSRAVRTGPGAAQNAIRGRRTDRFAGNPGTSRRRQRAT